MKSAWFFLLPFLLLTTLLSAQKTQATKECSVEGIVTKTSDGTPLRKVSVWLESRVEYSEEAAHGYEAMTDGEGHFKIEGITPGHYYLVLQRPGFLLADKRRGFSNRVLSLEPGAQLKNLVISMTPTAVVVGRVLDEDGDPMPGIEVSALKQIYVRSHREWQAFQSQATNDLGEYRISDMPPGRYRFSASPGPRVDVQASDGKSHDEREDTSYLTTYYPGTADSNQATVLELRGGEETPINFTLLKGRTYRLRGTVSNSTEKQAGTTAPKGAILLRSRGGLDPVSASGR